MQINETIHLLVNNKYAFINLIKMHIQGIQASLEIMELLDIPITRQFEFAKSLHTDSVTLLNFLSKRIEEVANALRQ